MSIARAYNELSDKNIEAEREVSLKNHSTFKIGGIGALAVYPKNKAELAETIELLKSHEIKFRVLGRGSNVLFADEGYNGALIFTSKMSAVEINGKEIYAECGATMKSVALAAAREGLSGLEFIHGIPGSLGGGVYMNAGAYGGEISNFLKYSDYYNTKTGEFGRLDYDSHKFSYRHSIYADTPELVVLGACFELNFGHADSIKSTIDEYAFKRKNSQPLEYPNAGSAFKRPQNGFAAKMIDDLGLKGLTVGGAQVSEKHAGFIVNRGGATSADVLALMNEIKKKVALAYGVMLESEIEYVE